MKNPPEIKRFEHGSLLIDVEGFTQRHMNALLKLNALHGYQYFDSIPNGIKFKQYVGIIQVDNLTIEILPKADKDDDDSKWQKVLIEMLEACRKLKASTYGNAQVLRGRMNLLELYFQTFLQEVELLIHQGLVKKYRKETSNVKALKGKLIFSQHISRNYIHKERFFTEHQIYDKDHALHQILFQALKVIDHFSRGGWLSNQCKRVQLSFPEVSELTITAKLLNGFQFNRKTEPYVKAFELARLILLNYSPNVLSGNEKMIALLFDMNKLWEEYVYVKLREVLNDTEYKLEPKAYKPFWGSNSLQPDIVIEYGSEKLIIDTKWKTPGSYSASVQDLRQMYAYNRFWNAEKAVLLYPGDSSDTKFEIFENTENDGVIHMCKMAFVNVVDKDGNLNKQLGREILRELEFAIKIKVT